LIRGYQGTAGGRRNVQGWRGSKVLGAARVGNSENAGKRSEVNVVSLDWDGVAVGTQGGL